MKVVSWRRRTPGRVRQVLFACMLMNQYNDPSVVSLYDEKVSDEPVCHYTEKVLWADYQVLTVSKQVWWVSELVLWASELVLWAGVIS